MGQVKLLSDKAVNVWPYYDDGVWKIDRTRKKKRLSKTEQKLFMGQVATFYKIKYGLPEVPSEELMQRFWNGQRNPRRRYFLAQRRKYAAS